MKKLLTIILALAIFISALYLAVPTDALTAISVTVDGTVYKAHKGDIIRYTCYLDMSSVELGKGGKAGRITELEGKLYYDKSRLKLITDLTPDPDDGYYPSMPNIKSGSFVLSDASSTYLGYNAVNTSGYSFSKKKILFKADFEVTVAKKSSITNVIECLGSGTVKLIESQQVFIDPGLSYKITVECSHSTPTEAPTVAPTQKPTQAPTSAPTQKPTQKPTQAPTAAPTQKPTQKPTQAPTAAPTQKPTQKPTQAPTAAPTQKPTQKPTQAPTAAPTQKPTQKPTQAPTAAPTQKPTQKPTQAPTVAPTQKPTQKPTQAPTSAPTQKPTQKPTQAPTVAPTQKPTQKPTQAPTAAPTQKPTQKPTQPATQPSTSAPEVLADETTGVTAQFEPGANAVLNVRVMQPKESGYVLSDSEHNTVYEVTVTSALSAKTAGAPKATFLTFPAPKKSAKLYTVKANGQIVQLEAVTTKVYNSATGKNEYFLVTAVTDAVTYIVSTSTSAPHKYDIGDVDMDDMMTVMDATFIQRALCDLKTLNSTQELLSDYDRDGNKTIMDVTAIQRRLAEIN